VQNQWVKKNLDPKKQFDTQKEKEIFIEAPEYDMLPSLDHTNRTQPKEQVSTIKDFLQSCIKMLSDPSSIKVLQNILEKCSSEME
jgi:hypothetical protein